MFIRNPIKKYKILANENSNDKLQPRILKENIVKDRDGRDKSILTIKLFCRIDLDAADEVVFSSVWALTSLSRIFEATTVVCVIFHNVL